MKYDKIKLHFQIDCYRIHIMRMSYGRIDSIIPMHSHSENSYEIHYIASGKGSVVLNGIPRLLVPHTLFVTGPLINHEQIPDNEDPMVEYCINICVEKDPAVAQSNSFISQFISTNQWLGQDTLNASQIMIRIFHELSVEDSGYPLAVTGLIQYLLVVIARLYSLHTFQPATVPKPLLPMTHFCTIEDAFLFEYKDLTIEQLASRLNLSVRQTERLLQKNYASTFKQMKVRARLSAAAAFFQEGHSTEQVAEEVGYSSVEHFCRAFKKQHLVSVTQYRASLESAAK